MTHELAVSVDPSLAAVVRVGALGVDAAVVEREPRLDAALNAAEERMRQTGDGEAIIAAVRRLYRAVGLDPTKTRPSSEALLRRVKKGEPLPRVNSAVDVCNWCSLETHLPFGLYDVDRISGDIELRLGAPGEEYAGIRKDVVHVAGRVVLADADGPFGNPTSDSARTSVTLATTRLLFVIFGPGAAGPEVVAAALTLTAERAAAYLGGREWLRVVR